MNPPNPSAQSSTPPRAGSLVQPLLPGPGEEDVAIGWECANPALQIDSWTVEGTAQPLQQCY